MKERVETVSGQPNISPEWPTPANSAWDEAFLRVESYLRSHNLESRVLLNQLSTDIIREARERLATRSGEDPVTASMHVTHARIAAWFIRAGIMGDWSDERVRARSRLALILTHLTETDPECFLSSKPIPMEISSALSSLVLQPGPELRLTHMPSAPLEFGFDVPQNRGTRPKGVWPVVQPASGWLTIVVGYGFAWAASH